MCEHICFGESRAASALGTCGGPQLRAVGIWQMNPAPSQEKSRHGFWCPDLARASPFEGCKRPLFTSSYQNDKMRRKCLCATRYGTGRIIAGAGESSPKGCAICYLLILAMTMEIIDNINRVKHASSN